MIPSFCHLEDENAAINAHVAMVCSPAKACDGMHVAQIDIVHSENFAIIEEDESADSFSLGGCLPKFSLLFLFRALQLRLARAVDVRATL